MAKTMTKLELQKVWWKFFRSAKSLQMKRIRDTSKTDPEITYLEKVHTIDATNLNKEDDETNIESLTITVNGKTIKYTVVGDIVEKEEAGKDKEILVELDLEQEQKSLGLPVVINPMAGASQTNLVPKAPKNASTSTKDTTQSQADSNAAPPVSTETQNATSGVSDTWPKGLRKAIEKLELEVKVTKRKSDTNKPEETKKKFNTALKGALFYPVLGTPKDKKPSDLKEEYQAIALAIGCPNSKSDGEETNEFQNGFVARIGKFFDFEEKPPIGTTTQYKIKEKEKHPDFAQEEKKEASDLDSSSPPEGYKNDNPKIIDWYKRKIDKVIQDRESGIEDRVSFFKSKLSDVKKTEAESLIQIERTKYQSSKEDFSNSIRNATSSITDRKKLTQQEITLIRGIESVLDDADSVSRLVRINRNLSEKKPEIKRNNTEGFGINGFQAATERNKNKPALDAVISDIESLFNDLLNPKIKLVDRNSLKSLLLDHYINKLGGGFSYNNDKKYFAPSALIQQIENENVDTENVKLIQGNIDFIYTKQQELEARTQSAMNKVISGILDIHFCEGVKIFDSNNKEELTKIDDLIKAFGKGKKSEFSDIDEILSSIRSKGGSENRAVMLSNIAGSLLRILSKDGTLESCLENLEYSAELRRVLGIEEDFFKNDAFKKAVSLMTSDEGLNALKASHNQRVEGFRKDFSNLSSELKERAFYKDAINTKYQTKGASSLDRLNPEVEPDENEYQVILYQSIKKDEIDAAKQSLIAKISEIKARADGRQETLNPKLIPHTLIDLKNEAIGEVAKGGISEEEFKTRITGVRKEISLLAIQASASEVVSNANIEVEINKKEKEISDIKLQISITIADKLNQTEMSILKLEKKKEKVESVDLNSLENLNSLEKSKKTLTEMMKEVNGYIKSRIEIGSTMSEEVLEKYELKSNSEEGLKFGSIIREMVQLESLKNELKILRNVKSNPQLAQESNPETTNDSDQFKAGIDRLVTAKPIAKTQELKASQNPQLRNLNSQSRSQSQSQLTRIWSKNPNTGVADSKRAESVNGARSLGMRQPSYLATRMPNSRSNRAKPKISFDELNKVTFEKGSKSFDAVDFTSAKMINCTFEETDFSNVTYFKSMTFKSCKFNKVDFSCFDNSADVKERLEKAGCKFTDCTFEKNENTTPSTSVVNPIASTLKKNNQLSK